MKKTRRILPLLLLAVLLLTGCAVDSYDEGNVVFGGAFYLESGERVDGDLAIFGAAAELGEDSTVAGDVFILGGNLIGAGTIEGELVIVGGNADLRPTAAVEGDVITIGGGFNPNGARVEGDRIAGDNITAVPFDMDWVSGIQVPSDILDGINIPVQTRIENYFINSFMLAVIAALIMLFAPRAVDRIAQGVFAKPVQAGGLGLLTTIVYPLLLVIMVVTVCLIPFALLAVLLIVLAWVFGLVAIGLEIGKRIFKALDQDVHPVLSGSLGTLVLALVVNGIGLIPCVGWLVQYFVGVFGLGAVILTRFGTQPTQLVETLPEEGALVIEELPSTDGEEADQA